MTAPESIASESNSLPSAFRRQCEHIATRERYALSLKAFDALPAQLLADAYQATVLTPDQLPNVEANIIKLVLQQPGWSAVLISTAPLTFCTTLCTRQPGSKPIFIMNLRTSS